MNKVTRNLAVVLALGFLLAGVVVLMRTLTGERVESYVFPCALIGGGLFTGVLAWNFGSDVGVIGMCTSEEVAGGDGVEGSGSDNAD
jgi:hypothetical protein